MKAHHSSPWNIKPWPLRLLLILPTAAAVLLIWDAVVRLSRVERELALLTPQVAGLTRDIEQLEKRWPAAEIKDLESRRSETLGTLAPANDTVLLWLQQARARAALLGLDFTPHFGTPLVRPFGNDQIALVPATLEIRPAAGEDSNRSVYQRLLDFSLFLGTQTNRADLLELSVALDKTAMPTATLNYSLWSKEVGP